MEYISPVLGFGHGQTDKDNKLETLADNGNGNYSYIDSVDEAYRVLGAEMKRNTFPPLPRTLKYRLSSIPRRRREHRLIGYDNRLMNAEDFYDESKDAGRSSEQVTVLRLCMRNACRHKYLSRRNKF